MSDESYLRIRFKFFFRWYDLWVEAYINTKGKEIYICPIPMFGLKVWWYRISFSEAHKLKGWKEATDYMREMFRIGRSQDEVYESMKDIAELP